MKISVKRLKQIIKEELENIAEYEREHPEGNCITVHAGMDHKDWAEGERSMMSEEFSVTEEELEHILAEDDWDYLEEEEFYEG